MANNFITKIKHAWNAFMNRDPPFEETKEFYQTNTSSERPDAIRINGRNAKTIVSAIINRIAMDCASVDIHHVTLDNDGRYKSEKKSSLNNCFTLEANKDQNSQAFKQDMFVSMLDEGTVAVMPVDVDKNPNKDEYFDIYTMRTARVTAWKPDMVKLWVYNDRTGTRQEIWMKKKCVAIIDNPFSAIMNEPNSLLNRLNRKIALLDAIDEKVNSSKLNLIIQLPYVIRSEEKMKTAEKRRTEIEEQLVNSKYGIAYTDGTEKITQLNRPLDNNLQEQIKYLTENYMSQIGMTQSILDGTADERTMTNYKSRVISQILSVTVLELKRKFLSEDARNANESIEYYEDPFKLIPVSQIAEIADKLTRNEIMTSNEIRQKIGLKPSSDPEADILRNKNLNKSANEPNVPIETQVQEEQNY